MGIADLKNKLVAVLGYGVEGKTVTRYLLGHGLKPVLFDQRPWGKWEIKEQKVIQALGLHFIFGPDCFKELAGFDIAFRSPGIPLSHPDIRLRIKDKGLKIILTSQTQWFFEHSPAKIIGVTGTKGKGTTAALTAEILKLQAKQENDGREVYLTGNIGKTQPLEILDGLTARDLVVYELSSFQLQDLTVSPKIAVVLMVTKEHLDYHQNEKEYAAAKEAITRYQGLQDFAVINADFPKSTNIGGLCVGKKFFFSRRKSVSPGAFVESGKILFTDPSGAKQEVLKIKDLQLRGAHNLENICAAVTAAYLAKANFEVIRQACLDFKGLEHRLELAGEKQGIKFYDDSFSTTPETAIACIKSFRDPEIVILGGSSKNSDFSELGKVVAQTKNIKHVILIGREAAKIKQAILKHLPQEPERFFLEGAKNMTGVFAQIKTVGKPGDIVLLSPACASFDMFENYEQRGQEFKQNVETFST